MARGEIDFKMIKVVVNGEFCSCLLTRPAGRGTPGGAAARDNTGADPERLGDNPVSTLSVIHILYSPKCRLICQPANWPPAVVSLKRDEATSGHAEHL